MYPTLLIWLSSLARGYHSLNAMSLLYITYTRPHFIALLPSMVPTESVLPSNRRLLIYSLIYILSTGGIFYYQIANQPLDMAYSPSLGMLWYLDAQVFPSLRWYILSLLFLQPVFLSYLLRLVIVNSKTHAIIIIYIIFLYSKSLFIQDVVFMLSLLSSQFSIASKMNKWPIICLGISLPLALSPVLLSLWVKLGSANANFLFFNGVFLWVILAVMVIEFTAVSLNFYGSPYKTTKAAHNG